MLLLLLTISLLHVGNRYLFFTETEEIRLGECVYSYIHAVNIAIVF